MPTPVNEPVSVEIQLDGESTICQLQPGETILELALREGLDAPYSCTSGICTSCQAQLLSGQVMMENNEALSDEDIVSGEVLTCQAKPISCEKITVQYPSDSL